MYPLPLLGGYADCCPCPTNELWTRFNQGGQAESAIVTSTGPYVIAWDFAKVKRGFLDKYEIKKYEDEVVQDNFKFGDDNEIVRCSLMTSINPDLTSFRLLLCKTTY
jgi:hypothetical protein